jgi:hypothetical protein
MDSIVKREGRRGELINESSAFLRPKLEERLTRVEMRLTHVETKVDGVAADLAAHRANTEAQRGRIGCGRSKGEGKQRRGLKIERAFRLLHRPHRNLLTFVKIKETMCANPLDTLTWAVRARPGRNMDRHQTMHVGHIWPTCFFGVLANMILH